MGAARITWAWSSVTSTSDLSRPALAASSGILQSYLAASPGSLVISARLADRRLGAFVVGEFASLHTAFFMFSFRDLRLAPPGSTDLLLSALLDEAAHRGHRRMNLGLGINEGIRFFKVPKDKGDAKIGVSRTIIQHVIKNSEGVLSSNAMTDRRFAAGDSVQQFHIRSAICSPIRFQDRVFGVVYIDSSIASRGGIPGCATDNNIGSDIQDARAPTLPELRRQDPEKSVNRTKSRTMGGALQDGNRLPHGEVLGHEDGAADEDRPRDRPEELNDAHRGPPE